MISNDLTSEITKEFMCKLPDNFWQFLQCNPILFFVVIGFVFVIILFLYLIMKTNYEILGEIKKK